ncbi:MAG TPA: hypothetical protein VHF90_02025 [Thermoleophilaceae bacterium]|nr:hypothetical protein [Thermoleophilaceae bacterium]
MNLQRLRAGEWVLGVSGALLLISLFLPWWGLEGDWIDLGPGGPVEGADQGPGVVTTWTAWQVLSVADVLLALLGLLALVVWAIVARASAAGPGITGEALLTPFAIAMAIVVAVQVLGTPGALEAPPPFDPTVEYGAWLGLLSSLGVLVGLLVGMRDERLSRPGELTDQTGAPASAPVAVETLPGP